MRELVLLRGPIGVGKSTWVKQQGLEPYTISPDALRIMIQNPVYQVDGTMTSTEKNDKFVWELVKQLLEERMKRGEFTVIDATHIKRARITGYRQLCRDYRYRCTVVDFTQEAELEEILRRNRQRPEYKVVPDEAVIKSIEKIEEEKKPPSWTRVVKPDEFQQVNQFPPLDFTEYKRIHHIGDIHGCWDSLNEYFSNGFKKDELYIFTGDYIDRGPQNAEVLQFLFKVHKFPNVILLEGNHESHLWRWASGLESHSIEFVEKTQPQLEAAGFDKKIMRQFYRRLRSCVYYTYGKYTVFVSHGGVSTLLPNMLFMSSDELIKGVGKRKDDIDAIWNENTSGHLYQVHGHRNRYRLPTQTGRSFNVEGQIEEGGHLRSAVLSAYGWEVIEIKNENYIKKD